MIYGFVPYSFALALMIGVLGWFLSRPKPPPAIHATAASDASKTALAQA